MCHEGTFSIYKFTHVAWYTSTGPMALLTKCWLRKPEEKSKKNQSYSQSPLSVFVWCEWRRCIPDNLCTYPDSKVHGANMGPIWGRQDPGGPHVGPMNFALWVMLQNVNVQLPWLYQHHFKQIAALCSVILCPCQLMQGVKIPRE